ncbi:MAG: hypothetical protein ACOYEI_07770 [Acetivibrionales bacterium]|jgi:uncharacterized protein YhhL (DUF1145 family)|nr:hypothetical protein [Clostridiaceae bacterium]
MIENLNGELKKYLEGKPVVSALLSFDMIVLYVAAGLMLLNLITPLGGFVSGLLLYVLLLGVVLCLANNNFTALMIGLGVKAGIEIVYLLISIFGKYRAFSWSSLYAAVIFGFFAFLAYKKTFSK